MKHFLRCVSGVPFLLTPLLGSARSLCSLNGKFVGFSVSASDVEGLWNQPIKVVRMVVENTIEDRILRLQEKKRLVFER